MILYHGFFLEITKPDLVHSRLNVDFGRLKFNSYCEEWLDFILNCRSGKDLTRYDMVTGGVANDKVQWSYYISSRGITTGIYR